MSDLIICINFDESKKKQGLIIETYEGTIPHLKSKQYSGPLRNVNLSSTIEADNLSSAEINNIKKEFNQKENLQISKYQYIYSSNHFPFLEFLVEKHCLFYKDKKSPMYEVEYLSLNNPKEGMKPLHDFSYYTHGTSVFLNYDANRLDIKSAEVTALFYIDIHSSNYEGQLFFDYGNALIEFNKKENTIENSFRNYKFEKDTIALIENCNWKCYQKEAFRYYGKDIADDAKNLIAHGIKLFTNSQKEITTADFSNIKISYGIDWFDIKGTVKLGNQSLSVGDLIKLNNKGGWTEYNNEAFFLPTNNIKATVEENGEVHASKSDILSTLEALSTISPDWTCNKENFLKFEDVTLHLPQRISSTLRDYQKIGVKWLLSLQRNGFGGCLADDMGLGKTLQIIAYLSDQSQEGRNALIIVPKTLLENWRREFCKFSPDTFCYIYHGTGRNLMDAINSKVVVTTYGTLVNDIEQISNCRFDNMIIDEAQNIKNSRSKAYRAVRLVHAETKILLTGTPIENNIREFWDLMRIVNPTKLTFNKISSGVDEKRVIEKIRKLTSPFLLRRYKKDVLKDLPEKIEQTIYCNFGDEQRELYNSMLESVRFEINRKSNRYEIKSNSYILSGLLYLQEICCHPKLIPIEYNKNGCTESAKLELLLSMVSELYFSSHKIVIFSRFTRMLNIINKELTKRHFNTFYLDGTTNNRQEVVDDFEKSKDGIFLISLKAGGVGLNLVSADTAIIYDPWWNPAVEKQAQDRIYRIGQKNKVSIFKLIVANTVEEKVQLLQNKKKELFEQVIGGHEIPTGLTMEDINELVAE